MSVGTLIFCYLLVLLGGLAGVGLYYEHRQRRFGPMRSPDSIFRCQECELVYTDDVGVGRSRCPQCGASNEIFKF